MRSSEGDGSAGATIGVDVGGTKIAAGIRHGDGSHEIVATLPTRRGDGEANTRSLREAVAACGLPPTTPIGLSLTTTLDPHGRLRDLAGWLGWAGRSAAELVGRPDATVTAANDAACGAYAEAVTGAGRDTEDVLYVTLGTGLAHSQVTAGRLVVGAHGAALFSGYMRPGRCLTAGCDADRIEDLVAGPMIARAWDGSTDAHALVAAWKQGDPRADAVVRHAASHLGDYLATLLLTYDPAVLVIGGGLAAGVPEYVRLATEEARTSLPLPFLRSTPVVPAALGADAGWIGAAMLAAGTRGHPSVDGAAVG